MPTCPDRNRIVQKLDEVGVALAALEAQREHRHQAEMRALGDLSAVLQAWRDRLAARSRRVVSLL
jgi:hypothetical protein